MDFQEIEVLDITIIYFIQTWPSVENGSLHTNSKLLVNLTFWKTEYLIAQLRTGFRQKVFILKTCPQGVLKVQQEKSKNLIFTTLLWAGPAQNPPLNVEGQLISKTNCQAMDSSKKTNEWIRFY